MVRSSTGTGRNDSVNVQGLGGSQKALKVLAKGAGRYFMAADCNVISLLINDVQASICPFRSPILLSVHPPDTFWCVVA